MGLAELQCFKQVEILHGKKVLNMALDMTGDDIKANRVAFNKKTNVKEFMRIFFRSVNVCLR